MPVATPSVDVLLDPRAQAETIANGIANGIVETRSAGEYSVSLAANQQEREAAYRLRFIVFNLELNEGLDSAYANGFDTDRFDDVCDHLIVRHNVTNAVIGTYRLQRGDVAKQYFGYYSEQEFDFTPFEHMRSQIVELGRACIHRDHRSSEVLHLLWRAIARYVLAHGGRYMMGCCSLSSTDAALGHAVYRGLRNYTVEPSLMTVPTAPFLLPADDTITEDTRPPKLLRAYLTIGARICSQPALDREFRTIDFLTLLDLQTLHPRVAARFPGHPLTKRHGTHKPSIQKPICLCPSCCHPQRGSAVALAVALALAVAVGWKRGALAPRKSPTAQTALALALSPSSPKGTRTSSSQKNPSP